MKAGGELQPLVVMTTNSIEFISIVQPPRGPD